MRILSRMSGKEVDQIFLIPSEHQNYLLPGDPRVRTYPQAKRGLSGCWQQAKYIQRCIKELSPDILFLHSSFSLVALVLLRMRGLSTPVMYCPHGWAVSRYKNDSLKAKLVAFIEGLLVALPDVTVNISKYDLELARRLGYRGRHELLENAVPPPTENASPNLFKAEPESLHLLFVGRLDRQKGYDILISAFKEARKHRKDLRLHIVGEAVRADGSTITASEGVDFAGWIDSGKLDDWYRSADVLVVPSRWEGFGLVVAEALRNGTPVICSDRGALPDLVREDETGHVFSFGVEGLVSCLTSLDRKALHAMRPACSASYKSRFSIERFDNDLLNRYQDLLEIAP
jgi:glycosyltransferase involved in cell wall biosynthesis